MPRPSVSIVVPTYKEALNIPILVPRLFDALRPAGYEAELILVDDNSQDGTDAVVKELAGNHPVRLIVRTSERGLSSAVVRGFDEAKGEILLCMDADLSHPPESAPDVIAPIANGQADFCIGSRYVAGGKTKEDWGFLRQLNSKVATLLAMPLTTAKDPMAGFFCISRETYHRAKSAGLNPIGYKIALEIMIKARCERVMEVPIEFSDRLHGKSKLTLRQQLEYLRHLSRLYRFKRPATSVVAVVGAVGVLFAGIVWATRLFR